LVAGLTFGAVLVASRIVDRTFEVGLVVEVVEAVDVTAELF